MRDKGVQPIRLATWALAVLLAGLLAAAPALAQNQGAPLRASPLGR